MTDEQAEELLSKIDDLSSLLERLLSRLEDIKYNTNGLKTVRRI